MGDRDLAVWVGNQEGGIYAFATYTYTDLNGNGNPNLFQLVKYKDDIKEWHFIYFAYSRKKRSAYASISFKNRKEELTFPNVNHYLAR